MTGKKGFTLIEIITALVITGVLAAIAIPNYYNSIQQGASNAAQNNLTIIYGAQKNYYYNNGSYCVNSGSNPTCADNLADINTNLSLNITDNYFTYACAPDPSSGVYCTATNISNPQINFSVNKSTGGSSCAPPCTSPQTCGGGGTPNVCGCTPTRTCSSMDAECGSILDDCGNTVSCGSCMGHYMCFTFSCPVSGMCGGFCALPGHNGPPADCRVDYDCSGLNETCVSGHCQ
jgi:prepilin-type N-terminal cleavage/methylation domain-containing protein